MKKIVALALVALSFAAFFPAPAKADTSIIVSFNSQTKIDRHARPNKRIVHERPAFHHRPSAAPHVFWKAFYTPRPIIVERTVVRPVYQTIVQQAPIQAVPASPDYVTAAGQVCREYQADGIVAGSTGIVYGTACMQSDGSWRVVN